MMRGSESGEASHSRKRITVDPHLILSPPLNTYSIRAIPSTNVPFGVWPSYSTICPLLNLIEKWFLDASGSFRQTSLSAALPKVTPSDGMGISRLACEPERITILGCCIFLGE